MFEPVELRIILASNNTEKPTIASSMPKSVEDLSDETKRQFDIQGDIRHQTFSGFYGWKISLKYKMANYRTKLRNLECPELSINSLKHKPTDRYHPAYAVKKPRKAEVNFCPSYQAGETQDSLESERLAFLTEVKKKHNEQCWD